MENLEGKYFEKTIAALKQLKNEESINLRPEFRAELRGALVEKALGLPQSNAFDWADFVLRFKYLMAGVPVLAVMTIVAANIYNWQVKLPTQQIIPVVTENKSQTADGPSQEEIFSLNQNTMADLTSQKPPVLETFPADSVMPPLEALIAARERLANNNQPLFQGYQEIQLPSLEVYQVNLAEMKLPAVNVEPPVTSKSVLNDSVEKPSSDSNTPKFIFNGDTANITNWVDTIIQPVREGSDAFRLENNGRVEQTGRLEDFPMEEKNLVTQPVNGQPLEQQSLNVQPELSMPSLKVGEESIDNTQPELNADSATQLMIEQPTLKLETSQEVLDGKGEFSKDSFINVLEEKKTVTEGIELKLQTDNLALLPTYLDDNRIYFDGEERNEVLVAVKRGLYAKNGSLSSDYYVKVKRLDNGNYKAFLFEYGQVQQILILGYRGGELVVITEVQY